MSTKDAPTLDAQDEINRRLEGAGQRLTKGRRSVIEAMQSSDAPLSIPELQTIVGTSVPLSSLYRIITGLVDAKVLVKLEFAEGFARFELDESLDQHHHHLVCTDCGSVADVELADLEITLHATTKSIKRKVGFQVATHRLDFFGTCNDCTLT
jgi:Fur family transcriptional regulator, ferric uptake regulator